METKFRVGVAREIITPPLGTVLYGYPDQRRATSIHDDLKLTVFAFESDNERLIMITADICAHGTDEVASLKKKINAATGVPESHITFSATHTHSGPCTRVSTGWGDRNDEFINLILNPAAIRASVCAIENLKDATMGIGCVESEVGINRRERRIDGTIALGQNPWGIFNKEIHIISFRDSDGNIIGSMIHYGTHCTASGATPVITRDWAGVMVDALEAECGGIAAFFAGPSGDTGPRLPNGKTTGNIELMEALGKKAGVDAVRAYNSITEYKKPVLKTIVDRVRLPYEPLMPYDKAKSLLDEILKKGPYETLFGRDKKAARKYMDVLEHYDKNLPDLDALYYDATLIALGDLVFASFPFEVFSEIALRIDYHSPFEKTLILNNTNGSLAYFPTKSELAVGGYEAVMFTWFQTYTPISDADTVAVNEYVRILNLLKMN